MLISIKDPPRSIQLGSRKYYLTAQLFYAGVNFHVRKRIIDMVKAIIGAHYVSQGFAGSELKTPVAITITIVNDFKTNQDLDNKAYFWNKVIQDFLVQQKVIPDDSIKYIKRLCFEYRHGEPEIIIQIDEV